MKKTPLIHVLNNNVTTLFVADGVLAYGGSPICSETPEEYKDLYKHIDALIVNLGTLSKSRKLAIIKACHHAALNGVPIGIDPTGIHLSHWRMETFKHLIRTFPIAYVRGNRDEIHHFIAPESSAHCKSLEANHTFSDTLFQEKLLSSKIHWLITGPYDLSIGNNFLERIGGGCNKLRALSGAGCLLSALVAVNLGKGDDVISSSIRASNDFKIAATTNADIPLGHLKSALITSLHTLGASQ